MPGNNDQQSRELLIRLDERLLLIQQKVEEIGKRMDDLEKNYVTKETFNPVQRAVYAAIGFIMVGVIGAMLNIVLLKP